ncbi:MAG: 30S ribosomal protein S9 [Candidatus Liptonbacteria bacterium]
MAESKKYFEAVGRRKTAVARVRLEEGKGEPSVNGKSLDKYFDTQILRDIAQAPVSELKVKSSVHYSAKVTGGGVHAQAEAIRHGLSRALVRFNEENKSRLRTLGFLTRDPRMVERKKYGLKKARRRPQWAKR